MQDEVVTYFARYCKEPEKVAERFINDAYKHHCMRERDVEPGDKLFLNGCVDSSSCSTAQYCFHDVAGTTGSTGLCLDRPPVDPNNTFDEKTDTSNGACSDWLQGVLHYRITAVNQKTGKEPGSTLVLDELPLPEHPVDQRPGGAECVADTDCAPLVTFRGTTPITLQTSCLDVGGGAKGCVVACDWRDPAHADCGVGYICAASVHDGGAHGPERCLPRRSRPRPAAPAPTTPPAAPGCSAAPTRATARRSAPRCASPSCRATRSTPARASS